MFIQRWAALLFHWHGGWTLVDGAATHQYHVHMVTVLLNSIRQSRVTGVLDVTNFATLSRVTDGYILFVTVGPKFRFRAARSNVP
jgi:hypothetical protein